MRPAVADTHTPDPASAEHSDDARRIARLREALRWEAITRAQHELAVEALRELSSHGGLAAALPA